jgi:DNA (cytosine-5)-methyltransferase 1
MLGIKGKRSSLYTYIVKAVEKVKPKVFVAENVGGLLLKQNEYSLKKILEDFNSLRYDISEPKLYNAADYGVPQTRDRIFIVGTQKGLPKFTPPMPTHTKPVTAKEAIGDFRGTRTRRGVFTYLEPC